ncbi:hypothetical protein NliqN6_3393 [Naganishia liquefaciens]|uniref:Uncharacterized protein n=1 Tax=Naganishia liquefaciens TaxID=104408 RepID=A0A8H3TU55_9TREE|nr:hypothetical protein NliqN6_3393 [Naganishia liquefaciens]
MTTSSKSHVMKTTARGRPFVKDTHDLFATLIVSLELGNHRYLFRNYPNSFTVEEAAHNLSTLKFSQSTRSPDPNDAAKIITTTTTTTFSMTRDMAKGICQYFMDARLIENAADPKASQFKDRGVYIITPKGLHILERFITKNGISADHLLKVFAEQPICMRLLHLERRPSDDEVLISRPVMEILFRRFVGKHPNVSPSATGKPGMGNLVAAGKSLGNLSASSLHEANRSLGITVYESSPSPKMPKIVNLNRLPPTADRQEYIFSAEAAVEWLNDLTTLVGKDEASEIAAHFVRFGFIALVPDKIGKLIDQTKLVVVRGPKSLKEDSEALVEAEFLFSEKTMYKITPQGMRIARWATESQKLLSGPPSTYSLSAQSSEDGDVGTPRVPQRAGHVPRRPSTADPMGKDLLSGPMEKMQLKDSYTTKLRQILEESNLRSAFREFLRSNFCEENLSFWLDVQDFKRRFHTTSSAMAVPGERRTGEKGLSGPAAMERHQRDLIAMAFVIYNTYLAPTSSCELNIDHNIREELVAYMSKIVADVSAREGAAAVIKGTLDPAIAAKTLHASQLQTMVRLYERIQGYIFRLMATDSVPKFCKTPKYMDHTKSLLDSIGEGNDMNEQKSPGDASGIEYRDDLTSPTKSYITISQAANEKHAALLQQMKHQSQPL